MSTSGLPAHEHAYVLTLRTEACAHPNAHTYTYRRWQSVAVSFRMCRFIGSGRGGEKGQCSSLFVNGETEAPSRQSLLLSMISGWGLSSLPNV